MATGYGRSSIQEDGYKRQALEGALSTDGQIMASYCDGLFDAPQALAALLEWAGHRPDSHFDPDERRQRDLDRLADAVEESLDLERLAELLPFNSIHQAKEDR